MLFKGDGYGVTCNYLLFIFLKHREECKDFSIYNHVFVISQSISMNAIREYCQLQTTESFQYNQPLWKAVIFSDVEEIEGSSVILFQYHHCLADGITMMQMLLTESNYLLDVCFDCNDSLRRKRMIMKNRC